MTTWQKSVIEKVKADYLAKLRRGETVSIWKPVPVSNQVTHNNKMNMTNPNQLRSVDRMIKRGFKIDYTRVRDFKPIAMMSRVLNNAKRYVEVTADGLVNGQPEGVFV